VIGDCDPVWFEREGKRREGVAFTALLLLVTGMVAGWVVRLYPSVN
jgi:hypothetical protein